MFASHPLVNPDLEENELVARSQRGDHAAFNELVIRYRHKAYAMIYNMVRNEQDAWDLAQEGFIRAWKSLPRFKGDSAFFTWLYRIMTNAAIDWMRKKQVAGFKEFDDRVAELEADPTSVLVPKAVEAPEKQMRNREIGERIQAAINQLSPEHRAVILLKEVEQLQYNEIAESVGCSIGTVMSRLFYARKKLQVQLKDLYENT